jgi:outer membrane receptor protein involved in Fe transport
MAIPIFRNDAAELSPVEALADPAGLGYLSFVEGGAGRSYELRVQRTTSRSATLTASAAYQRVRGLLVDTQDAALAALPTRVLIDRGQRWVTEASYEQWLSHTLTGRAFLRWQDSQGIFPEAHASGTQWPYAPHLQTGGRLDYIDTRGYRVGLEAVWVGRRFGDAANTRRVPGYAVLNLRAQYQRRVHECYFVDLTNLADRRYVTFDGFPQPGRAVVVGLDYRF